MTLAPTLQFPAGFYVMGLPDRPSVHQLDAIFRSVASQSPAIASLAPVFQLAPVLRRQRRSAPYFLTHPGFANLALVKRIMAELKSSGKIDSKGRARVSSPAGELKVSIAASCVRPALLDGTVDAATAAVEAAVGAPEPQASPTLPPELTGLRAIPFFGTLQDQAHACVCCREHFVVGESLLRLPCMHILHSSCMANWLRMPNARGRCPECNLQVALG